MLTQLLGLLIAENLEQKQIERGADSYALKKWDTEEVAQWRTRMGTAKGKTIYKLRCQAAEWGNAQCFNHGMQQMPVLE